MNKEMLGWREWVSLPDLGIPRIKAKVDTGARTSCIHAFFITTFKKNKKEYVKFKVHPVQKNIKEVAVCVAEVIDRRKVTDSGGHTQVRYVIKSTVVIGNESQEVEMTLTNRDTMRFRMLIGRKALEGKYLVDSEASYLGEARKAAEKSE